MGRVVSARFVESRCVPSRDGRRRLGSWLLYAQNIVGEVTLLNIAVAPALQGKGYGQKLLDAFLNHCEQAKADSAWLEVRESNHPAIHIYEQAGFNEVDRRYDYYPAKTGNGKEDAIIMSYLFFN